MKPPALLAILTGALALAGAFLYWQGRGHGEPEPAASPLVAPGSAHPNATPAGGDELVERLAELEARVDALTVEVESTRALLWREPALAEPEVVERSAGATPARSSPGSTRIRGKKHRPAVSEPAAPARAPRDDVADILAKAADVARRAKLTAEQEKVVGDLLLEEREKRRVIDEEAQRLGRSRTTSAWVRGQTADVDTWSRSQFEARLGLQVARQVQALRGAPKVAAKPSKKHVKRRR